MKKVFIMIIFAIFFTANVSIAKEVECALCPAVPSDISGGISSFLSNITGTNFVLTKIAENVIQKELAKQTDSKFNVELYAYGGKDLIDGKFKNIIITSKHVSTPEMNITDFKVESLCDYNVIKIDNDKIYFPENLIFAYSGKITSDDLKKTLMSQNYINSINNLSLSLGSLNFFKMLNPNVNIENNKIILSYDVMTNGLLGSSIHPLRLSADLGVENGVLKFKNINSGSSIANNATKVIVPIINKLNPVSYKLNVANNPNSVLKIKNVKIVNNEILLNGVVIIPKNYNK